MAVKKQTEFEQFYAQDRQEWRVWLRKTSALIIFSESVQS